jgi:antitoxin component of MazEF toxin-antitoxin module
LEKKIVKVGNSMGIIIPSIFLDELGFSYGDLVEVDYNKELKTLTIRSKDTTPDGNYLEQVVRSIVSEYLKEKGL